MLSWSLAQLYGHLVDETWSCLKVPSSYTSSGAKIYSNQWCSIATSPYLKPFGDWKLPLSLSVLAGNEENCREGQWTQIWKLVLSRNLIVHALLLIGDGLDIIFLKTVLTAWSKVSVCSIKPPNFGWIPYELWEPVELMSHLLYLQVGMIACLLNTALTSSPPIMTLFLVSELPVLTCKCA